MNDLVERTPLKLALVTPLPDYEKLVAQYCDERELKENYRDDLRRLYLGEFILWLRRRQEKTNEKPTN